MKVVVTAIPGVLIIEPDVFGDRRGFFTEIYQQARYLQCGLTQPFVQDNLSRSAGNVLRGLHIQSPNPQGKLVTALAGRILDVAVDVRVGSPTFGKHVAVELSDENRRQLWVPRNFAHGFAVLSESADVFYKCDAPYAPQDEIVVQWNDPAIGLDWTLGNPVLSERDRAGRSLRDLQDRLPRYDGDA